VRRPLLFLRALGASKFRLLALVLFASEE